MGDFEGASGAYDLTAGQDVTAIKVSTAVAGNTYNVEVSVVAPNDGDGSNDI